MGTPPPPPPGPPPPGPPPPPGFPPGGAPPPGYVPFGMPGGGPATRTNGMAVASLVLGVTGILLCFLFIPWILAIVFGAIAIRQCNADPSLTGRGLAIAGLSCGIAAGLLITLVLLAGDVTFAT